MWHQHLYQKHSVCEPNSTCYDVASYRLWLKSCFWPVLFRTLTKLYGRDHYHWALFRIFKRTRWSLGRTQPWTSRAAVMLTRDYPCVSLRLIINEVTADGERGSEVTQQMGLCLESAFVAGCQSLVTGVVYYQSLRTGSELNSGAFHRHGVRKDVRY